MEAVPEIRKESPSPELVEENATNNNKDDDDDYLEEDSIAFALTGSNPQ